MFEKYETWQQMFEKSEKEELTNMRLQGSS